MPFVIVHIVLLLKVSMLMLYYADDGFVVQQQLDSSQANEHPLQC